MRSLFWNTAATMTMTALLFLLALRACRELLGMDRLPCPGMPRGKSVLPSPAAESARRLSRREKAAVFFLAPLFLWLWALLLYFLTAAQPSPGGFLRLFLERFTVAGDAPHYLYLAEHGYARAGEKINLIVFYPLYPFLTGLLGRVLGGRYVLAGLLISQLSFGGAALTLCELAEEDCRRPYTALLAFLFYPQAFFALGIFTEGLFLLVFLRSLAAIRRERWLSAGIWGFFALLARVQGMALLPVFVYAAWRACRKTGWRNAMLAVFALPAGWGVYLLLNRLYTGDFFAFRYYESIRPWWQHVQWLGTTVAQQLDMADAYPWLGIIIYYPQFILYFLGMGLLIAGCFLGVPTEHLVCGGGYLGMCYLASWLISGGRYMFGCTGAYFTAGQLRDRRLSAALLLTELAAGAFFLSCFLRGESIM